MHFKDWLLQKRQLSPGSIKTYERYRKIFSKLLATTGSKAEELTYTDLLGYVKHCRENGLKQGYIIKLMGVVRHYYNYLKYTGKVNNNPAAGLYIKRQRSRLPHDLLTAEQLEEMYTGFNQKGLAGKRNKIMLGLMIYQGLNTQELILLESHHLKLREGKVEIPGTRRSNRRTLKLESHQVLDLQEYVIRTREQLLAITGKKSERLFVSNGKSNRLYNTIAGLVKHLTKTHDYFFNARQLRQSRIAIWIKSHDIRYVQYMAGHKYVSSTERYQSTNMEALREELEKRHPL